MPQSASHSITTQKRSEARDASRSDGLDSSEVINESTRLLPRDEEEAVANASNARPSRTPLPKAQLGALIIVRVVDPIAYQQIFPYINQLLADLKVAEPERVGFYSGLVESAYALAQVFSVYQLGKISDVVGRRPVVFTGLIGIAVTSITFGLSTSFTGIIASRFFGGLISGNVAVIHSIFAEITDETNQDVAAPIYGLSWPLGTTIGPLIGGTLENAATRYPQYFSWDIFVEHPYLPPCIASAVCALVGGILGYALIKETLPSKRKGVVVHASTAPGSQMEINLNGTEPASAMELLSVPAIRALTLSGFALSLLSLSFDVVFTLFCYTPVEAGGLGLEPSVIGNVFALAGVLSVLLRLLGLPYILQRFNYTTTYNVCMYIWPVAFGGIPFLSVLARVGALPPSSSGSSASSSAIWVGIFALLALSKVGVIPHTLSVLLVKRYAPSQSSLGRSNGLVQFAMCVGRAVGPIVVSSLFTEVNGIGWVRERGLGWAWVIPMVVGAIAGARTTKSIGRG